MAVKLLKQPHQIMQEIVGAICLNDDLSNICETFSTCNARNNFLSGIVFLDANQDDLPKLLPLVVAEITIVINNAYGPECQVNYLLMDNFVKFSITNDMLSNLKMM